MYLREFPALILALMVLWAVPAFAKPLQLPAIQVVPIEDSATGRDYELYIKLPEEYEPDGDTRHPVIYIADALWHIEIISGSIEYLVEDAILVGVSWEKDVPPQQSRMRDYTPTKYTGTNYEHPTGKAAEHLAFFKNDVLKYVESEYRADPARRSYFGYSASGTFGSYILLTQPKTFKNYIIGSPSTLFDGQFAHEHGPILKLTPDSLEANVFVSVGSDEEPKDVENAIDLVRFLNSKKASGSQVNLRIIESADHSSAFPISAVQGLYWLAELFEDPCSQEAEK